MVIRRNRETQHEFFGCSQWPECKYTEHLPESIKMIRAGVPVLPGFE